MACVKRHTLLSTWADAHVTHLASVTSGVDKIASVATLRGRITASLYVQSYNRVEESDVVADVRHAAQRQLHIPSSHAPATF
jgi:hypothetical protein